jgi:hypothetical protein
MHVEHMRCVTQILLNEHHKVFVLARASVADIRDNPPVELEQQSLEYVIVAIVKVSELLDYLVFARIDEHHLYLRLLLLSQIDLDVSVLFEQRKR